MNETEGDGDNMVIWKYMSFPKFSRLLDSAALFFCCADRLEDPWEATFPEFMFNIEFWEPWLLANNGQISTQAESREAAVALVEQLRELHKERARYAVSCWHGNDKEAEPFWKLYSDANYGVAIRSTVGKLLESLGEGPEVYMDAVRYIEFAGPSTDIEKQFVPALYKRADFQHEREIRAFCYDYFHSPPFSGNGGVDISVDLRELLDEVVISPKAPPWFIEHVGSVLRKYDLGNVPVRASRLYQAPNRHAPPAPRPSVTDRHPRPHELVVFNDRAAFESWRRREMAERHYPRFGVVLGTGAISLGFGLTTEITEPLTHPNGTDPRILCVVPSPHSTERLRVVTEDWARAEGWERP